jgi:hypothetical protein
VRMFDKHGTFRRLVVQTSRIEAALYS